MTLLILLIPIVVAIILLIFFAKDVVWWEYCILVIPSILLFFSIKSGMLRYSENDSEYLGYYISKVTYYEPWNEYIHRTCRMKVGKTVVNYDCSYVSNHPECFSYSLNSGEEIFVDQDEFERIKHHWKSSPKFRELNRHYYTEDGDAYDTEWDGSKLHCETRTRGESYINRIKASHSIFRFEDISKDDAKELGLFDYQDIDNKYEQQEPVIGYKGRDPRGIQQIKYINGVFGEKYQFRTFILVFYNKDEDIAAKQKSYWEGGNKNEFVICLGLNSHGNVEWCVPFSWQDTPSLEVKTKQYFLSNPKFNLYKYGCWLENNIRNNWKRKNFNDFQYIDVDLTGTQYIWLIIIVTIYNIGASLYVILNKYKNV